MIEYRPGRLPSPLVAIGIMMMALAWLFAAAPAEAQNRTLVVRGKVPAGVQKRVVRKVRRAPVPAVTARDAMLLIDAESGQELEGASADEKRHPASLTKMMTLYLTFEALDGGRLKLGDRMPVSAHAAAMSPSKLGVHAGSTLAVRDAIMGLITRSANDAAVVVGEMLAGDEATFARTMTQKARQLGMTSTTYRNASGLPDPAQVTTARDLARLAQALLRDFPHYYPLFSVQQYVYAGQPLRNHNQMLGWYPGADGIKTGYINASGFNLVMSAVRDGRRLIGVVLGGSTPSERDAMMGDMMDRGFERAGALKLARYHPARPPAGARYTAINFAPGAVIPEETPRTTITALVARGPVSAEFDGRTSAAGDASVDGAKWAIQLGAFATANAAAQAVQRAMSLLPDLRTMVRATIDTVPAT
ncbi:MAG: D-alanyl-D-alanine carboxypeptidase family protein, partial [Reyranellaceae bacterium]